MLDMQDIGYFLFMEQQEKKEREEQPKVNVKSNYDLEQEQTTQDEE